MLDGLGDRLRTWFSRTPRLSESYNPDTFEALCRERPSDALALLQKDRAELVQSFEDTIAAYRDRIAALDGALNAEGEADPHEVARIRDVQESLRAVMRRLEIALQSDREVEEELREWEMRHGEAGIRHADHPVLRTEIARSELALRGRGVEPRAIREEDSPFRAAFISAEPAEEAPADAFEGENDALQRINPHELRARIREATREVERWHALPHPSSEACEAARYVRDLNALLKRYDRERGVQRDRLVFAVRVR